MLLCTHLTLHTHTHVNIHTFFSGFLGRERDEFSDSPPIKRAKCLTLFGKCERKWHTYENPTSNKLNKHFECTFKFNKNREKSHTYPHSIKCRYFMLSLVCCLFSFSISLLFPLFVYNVYKCIGSELNLITLFL